MSTETTAEVQTAEPSTVETPVKQENSTYSYVFIGILVVVLMMMLYYAYGRFTDNSSGKSRSEPDERDDPVLDFNLREAIKELQQIQTRIMGTLSDCSDDI